MQPLTPPESRPPSTATGEPVPRREAKLDPAFHQLALAQMREEQADAARRRRYARWIGIPLVLGCFAASVLLDRDEHWALAHATDLVATGAAWILWRTLRDRLRD